MNVTIHTDGACMGNPGPGGWAAILSYGEHEKELSGSEKETTNNRMELTAVIKGLGALNRPCSVTVVSDSSYVCKAINDGWLNDWKGRGWKKKKGVLLNTDLWKELDALINYHKVKFEWVKGHAGNQLNEKCDAIAVAEYQKFIL